MDLGMPVMTGLQAAPEIAKAHPRLPMLLISVQEVSNQLAWEARNAGYRGAVTKSSGTEVLKGIEALLRHEVFFYSDDGSECEGRIVRSDAAFKLRDETKTTDMYQRTC